jgi:hypothetical protein
MREASERGLESSLALEAAEHLARAEKWQAEIASCATSRAEGMAGMAELHARESHGSGWFRLSLELGAVS